MRIAVVGYGKMGRMIEAVALARGHSVPVVVERAEVATPAGGGRVYPSVAEADFAGCDAALEFTRPDAAAANLCALAAASIDAVSGSTGWHSELPKVSEAVNAAERGLLWATNFSLGVNLFYRIASYAAGLIDRFPEYDAGGWEAHHNQKADSPSGTARTLADLVIAAMSRKERAVYETLNRPPAPDEFHYPSLRLGSVPGTHTLIFDSPSDTIEITHTARGREALALGAVRAAEWMTAKPRRGVFTLDDALGDLLGENLAALESR